MAVSLELRTPFLDYRMVEFAARLPSRLRVGLDATGRYRTKLILRRFAASRLPAEIVERPQQGFPLPVYGWLATGLRDCAHELLRGGEARLGSSCPAPTLAPVVQAGEAPDGGTSTQDTIWNLRLLHPQVS